MTSADLFVLAEESLTKVVDQIRDDQWELKVPPEFTAQGGDWTIRALINYHAYDDSWVSETLSGKRIDEVGKKYDGDLLGSDPKSSWHAIVEKALTAVKDANLTRTVHLSYGDYPAEEYLYHITLFRALRTVDFGRFLKLEYSLPDELVQGLWEYVLPNAAYFRQIGILGPEIKVPEDAPLFERFLGLTGRQPK